MGLLNCNPVCFDNKPSKNEPKCQNVSKIMVHAVFFFCIYLNNDGKNTKYTNSEATSTILPENLDIIVACHLFL